MGHRGSGRYAIGDKAVAICERCSEKRLRRTLVYDGQYPDLLVCTDCWDPKHPQEYLPPAFDPVTIYDPTGDPDRAAANALKVSFPVVSELTGGVGTSDGATIIQPAFPLSVSMTLNAKPTIDPDPFPSFATSPLNLVDNDIHYIGNQSVRLTFSYGINTSQVSHTVEANGAVSPLQLASPLQWHEDAPRTAASYSIRLVLDQGPDPLIFGTNIVEAWSVMSTDMQLRIARPASGTEDWSGIVELALTADLTTVLARGAVRLRYTRT